MTNELKKRREFFNTVPLWAAHALQEALPMVMIEEMRQRARSESESARRER